MNQDNREPKPAYTAIKGDDCLEVNYSLRYVRWLLRTLGVWPLITSGSSRFEKEAAKVVRPLAMLFMIVVIIPLIAEAIVQRADGEELVMLIAPITYQTSNFVKHLLTMFRADVIKMCTDHMTMDWRLIDNTKDRDIMMKNIRAAHALTTLITSTIFAGSLMYNLILPFCADSTINELNETVKPLRYPGGDIFFDVQASVVYEIVFFAYFISALSVDIVSMGLFNLALILVRHTCGQIQIVVSRLENLVDPDVESVSGLLVQNSIATIIHTHARLLKFSRYVETALKEICLVELVCATLLICFLEFYCIRDWANNNMVTVVTYVLIVATIAFNLYLYCQIGEILKEQCQDIGKAAYMIEWYKLPCKSSLNLILIMSMSAKPCQLTAGGMVEISRLTFANLMKTSFTYLNMLRTVT